MIHNNSLTTLSDIYLSTKLHRKQIDDLKQAIINENDEVLNQLVDDLLSLLTNSSNNKFRHELLHLLLECLATNDRFRSALFVQLYKRLSSLKDLNPTKSIAETLKFYVKLYSAIRYENLNDELKKSFINAQAIIFKFYSRLKVKKFYENNYKYFKKLMLKTSSSCFEDYYKIFYKSSLDSSTDISFVIFWDNMIRFEVENNLSNFTGHKSFIIDLFVKNIISSKIKIADQFDSYCFKNIINQFTKDDFQNNLFPLLQKAILRNPEISLCLLIFIMDHLNFDLSEFIQDLLKILDTHLISKNEELQEIALNSIKYISEKCSSEKAIEYGINHLSKIYHGSQGKLTILGQRHTVIKSIGNLSFNKVNFKQNLVDLVLSELVKMFKQETVESSIILLFNQIKIWIQNSPNCKITNNEFMNYLKDFFKFKSATHPAIASLFECLFPLFKSNNEHINEHITSIETVLLQLILNSSKNINLPLTKMPILAESLNASTLLLKMAQHQENIQEKLKNFLLSIQNPSTITFLTGKFIQQASTEYLLSLNDFNYTMIRLYHQKLDDEQLSYIYKACLFLLSHSSIEVRTEAIKEFNNFFNEDKKFPIKLIKSLIELFNASDNQEWTQEFNEKYKIVCCQTILSKCTIDNLNKENFQSIMNILELCSQPILYQINKELFRKFLDKNFNKETIYLILDDFFTHFFDNIMDSKLNDPVKFNMVKILINLDSHKFICPIVAKIVQYLDNNLLQYKSITEEELAIFNHSDGELYNQEIVLEAGKIHSDSNIKRESKLYSHKEQLAEIQLRKELEAKNKGQNERKKLDVKTMNKKQKEIYQQELEKEKNIRDRLNVLRERFLFYTNLLLTIIDNEPIVASIEFKDLLFNYVNLFSSVLVHNEAVNFFQTISQKMILMPNKNTDPFSSYIFIISNATIQAYSTDDSSPELIKLIQRVINFIYKETCSNSIKNNSTLNKNALTTPAFSFLFPLVRHVLLELNTVVEQNILEQCLQIISQNSLIRCPETNRINMKNPQNLPIRLILETLLKFLEINFDADFNEILLLASNTLTQVIYAVNNDLGAGKATVGDIMILLNYLNHQDNLIRLTCFEALFILSNYVLPFIKNDHCQQVLAHRCFVGQYDILLDCQSFSRKILELCGFKSSPMLLNVILNEDLEDVNFVMTHPVSEACTVLLKEFPSELKNCYEKLIKSYELYEKNSLPPVDAFGRPLSKTHVDHFESRLVIANIFKNIVHQFSENQAISFMDFLIPLALADNNEMVRSTMLEAGCDLINVQGKGYVTSFLNIFETFLDSAPDDHKLDEVRKSVIILMGTLGKHIEKDNPKLRPIISKLIEALSTPSQMVQEAVANCLQYLIPKFVNETPILMQNLLRFLLESEIYGERKGAAYGIAGIVKGLGILSINKLGIMEILIGAIETKNNQNKREGALFAFEMLSHILGRVFEPYIFILLPQLLDCFGDNSTRVRQAADDTAKVIMSNLSAYGVTLIFPIILEALEDDSWRKRSSSIDLLGMMAFCAPKQLSQCLPKIVPKLMDVITDSHSKVQLSAAHALKQIGSVIKNPEIQQVVPVLLEALQDPANKTNYCLNVLMKMKFVNTIDPPSLALVMPVIQRALQNRSTDTKKMASQIVGNMYELAKSKDLSPYLPSIIPGLKNSLLDPVPEVRSATAMALGKMVKKLGNEILDDLRPWLERMLISENSSVDRSGAAQGMAEVLGGLGTEHLDKYMPKIIEVTENLNVPSYVKDGYIMLYIYLPLVFTQHFSLYIGQVIKPILQALSDENESVRETALRAGQRLVDMYADTAIQLLLPELERGLFDENWRIRYSSVQLLGELLFKITGLSGKMTTESNHEDDNFGTEQSQEALFVALGQEHRNRILSGLYMGRLDDEYQVRHASLHVWKVIVPNTPRTLKEILPVLISLLLDCLACSSIEKQHLSARTLAELVRKLGERILPDIIPIMENSLNSDRQVQRCGVCIGMTEIIGTTSKSMVDVYSERIIAMVHKALMDPLPKVRFEAANTFQSIYSVVDEKAFTDIIIQLLEDIHDPEKGERALDSIKNILYYKNKMMLQYLIPKLTVKPINLKALAFISEVAGQDLSNYLNLIIPPILSMFSELFAKMDSNIEFDDDFKQKLAYYKKIVGSITDSYGGNYLFKSLWDSSKTTKIHIKRASVLLLASFTMNCKQTILIQSNAFVNVAVNYLELFGSDDPFIVEHSVNAFDSIIKILGWKKEVELVPELYKKLCLLLGEDYENSVSYRRNSNYSGFKNEKGTQAMIALFARSLLGNNNQIREMSIKGYRMVIIHADSEVFIPIVYVLIGPLLRILIDPGYLKFREIATELMAIMVSKLGLHMKPFFSHLQSALFRAIIEGERPLRIKTAICLGNYSAVNTKPNSFLSELLLLHAQVYYKSELKDTLYFTYRRALFSMNQDINHIISEEMYRTILPDKDCHIESVRNMAALVLGAICRHAKPYTFEKIVNNHLLNVDMENDIKNLLFQVIALKTALKDNSLKFIDDKNLYSSLQKTVINYINSKKTQLEIYGIKCATYMIKYLLENDIIPERELLQVFSKSMNKESIDVKKAVTSSTIFLSLNITKQIPNGLLQLLVPHLVNGTKENNRMIRMESEKALAILLKLNDDNSKIYQQCLECMSSGAVESLQDCVAKIRKNINKIDFQEEEPFDDEQKLL